MPAPEQGFDHPLIGRRPVAEPRAASYNTTAAADLITASGSHNGRYGERLAEIGAVPSIGIGTVGDSFDNPLAETVNGYYKAELIRGPAREGRPWKTVEDVELATLSSVHWHNHDRLHGYLDDIPPTEFEEAFYATNRTDRSLVGIQ